MTPGRARMKRGVRTAIESCGGGDGAAITAGRRRSVVYDWGNLNTENFPPLDCAHALDEVALAQDKAPPILHAYAAELSHIAVRVPMAIGAEDALTSALVDVSAEFGAIAAEVREATRDGIVEPHECDAIVLSIDKAFAALSRMRAVVRAPEAIEDRSRRPP
jgi:hypothetical protein